MQSVDNFSFGRVAVDVCPTPESVVQMKDAGFDFYQFHFPYDFDNMKKFVNGVSLLVLQICGWPPRFRLAIHFQSHF